MNVFLRIIIYTFEFALHSGIIILASLLTTFIIKENEILETTSYLKEKHEYRALQEL